MKKDSLDNAISKIARGGVFPDEETFQKTYDEFLENRPQAPESLQKAYKKMRTAFEDYAAECDEYTFLCAYKCGYEAALRSIKPDSISTNNAPWYLLKSLEGKSDAAV